MQHRRAHGGAASGALHDGYVCAAAVIAEGPMALAEVTSGAGRWAIAPARCMNLGWRPAAAPLAGARGVTNGSSNTGRASRAPTCQYHQDAAAVDRRHTALVGRTVAVDAGRGRHLP